jgi:hypothetical protein
LDAARASALDQADLTALTAVYAEGSPAYDTDRRLLERIIGAGLHAVGLHFAVESVEPLEVSGAMVRLRVVDRLDPYRLVGRDGTVIQSPGRAAATWDIRLTRVVDAWRITEVRRGDG